MLSDFWGKHSYMVSDLSASLPPDVFEIKSLNPELTYLARLDGWKAPGTLLVSPTPVQV